MERYNTLQKKLDNLDRVHQDGKKAHQAETERLKADLARCRKASAEQSDRIDKQKKHTDALDSRLNDLKRAALADQAEIKALKAKLRTAEQDKAQLAGKQADLLELKKAKQDTESKFTNNLRDRDSRIARLENSLAAETTKRESLERQINDLKSKTDADVRGTKQAETQLANVQHELSTARESFAQEREVFITRLENCKALLSHAAEQYASLASSTVPSSTHNKLKRLYHVVEFKVLRLERKLGNAEDQVNELAHLVRQTNHHSDLLETHLADANFQISIYDDLLYSHPPTIKTPPDDVDWNPNQTMNDHDLKASEAHLHELLATYYNLRSQQLVFAFSCIDKDLSIASSLAKQHSQDLANACASNQVITTNLDIAQQEHSSLSDQLCTLKDAHATLQRTCSSLQAQITSLKDQLYQTALDHQAEMKKDKEAVQRHTSAVQKSKMAEDALRAEIDRLLTDLADAERYQDAYNSLSEEVNSLLARNQLAEEEAERLGKFNAEILGHNNPAQRISYVDRIRRELADAKYRTIMLTREQENMVELNADLQHELDMYKSVAEKRTHITRVQRVPLSNVTPSLNAKLDPIPGEMTLDEII